MSAKTAERKNDHIKIVATKNVEPYCAAGFSDIRFMHHAVPEISVDSISTKTTFFGRSLSAPLLICGMTGGHPNATKINQELAVAAQEAEVAMGLGSQRAMLEDYSLVKTYDVRKFAPDVVLIGNIGAPQLSKYAPKEIDAAVQKVEADALAIHFNALQEVVQPEGDHDFSGVLSAIEKISDELSVPVIAKETGAGFSANAALALQEKGVKMIDVSGLGGTSWSKVEYYRGKAAPGFEDWGIPTAHSIAEVSREVVIPVIASGGIRNGMDAAKSMALGARYAGSASPFLKSALKDGSRGVLAELKTWKEQLRNTMFLTGCKNLEQLRKTSILITGRTAETLSLRGIDPREYAAR